MGGRGLQRRGCRSHRPVWWVNTKIAAGVELQAESSRTEARAVYLLGIVRFHPWERKGFFLRGGYGLVQVKAPLTLPDGTVSTAKYRGMALTYGAGWMFRQNRRVAWGLTGPTTWGRSGAPSSARSRPRTSSATPGSPA